ncbi:MAG: InlB B-repeat-containing protein [Acholeplasmatales bacterium]|nr:InlB B-repeat-containing protein [Acholeplasmatales bacterium]
MKKIKFLIASMLGAIALVFACVLGTRVNAADVSCSKTNTLSTVEANKYTLYSSTVSTDSNVTSNTDTTIIDTYTVFKFEGNKWGMYTSSENDTTVNGIAARKSDNICHIDIIIPAGMIVQFSGWFYSTDISKNYVTTISDGTNTTNWFDASQFTTKQVSEVKTSSEFTPTVDTKYSIIFANKCGFTTLSATVSSSSQKNVNFYVDGVKTSVEIGENGTVVMPSDPAKDGYTFSGWIKEDGTTFVNSNLSDSINVYADFSKNELTQTYIADYCELSSVNSSSNSDTIINDHITILAKDGQYEQVSFGTSKKKASDDVEVSSYVKLNGNGSKTYRCMKFIVDNEQDVKLYLYGSKDKDTMYTIINELDEEIVKQGTIASSSSPTAVIKHFLPGTYYLYCDRTDSTQQTALTLYGISYLSSYYAPNVSLSVDAKTELSKVRVVATIDNVDIDSSKVNGISSVVYTVYGATKTTNLPAAKLYTSIDFTDKGFYSQKNYTAYAVMVFSGYNSTNVTAAFDVKVTITLSNDVVVEKTISVPAPAAPSNN